MDVMPIYIGTNYAMLGVLCLGRKTKEMKYLRV